MKQVKTNQYPYYQSDVADEEYETEPPRSRSSIRRYQAGDYQGEPIPPVAQRSSLRRAAQSGRPTNGSQYRSEEFASAQTERLSADWRQRVSTQPSKAVKPLPSRVRQRWQDYRPEGNWIKRHLVSISGGMCAALLLIVVGWSLVAGYCNAIGDPLTYTQTAHRDTSMVIIAGHHAQVVAFLGDHERLEAIVIPDGGKPQLFQGDVVPFSKSMISVEQRKNGDIIVTAIGPFGDTLFPVRPITQSWKVPVDQKPAQK